MAKLAEELARLAQETIEREEKSRKSILEMTPDEFRIAIREIYEKLVKTLRGTAESGIRRKVVDLLNSYQYPETLRKRVFPHSGTFRNADMKVLEDELMNLLLVDGFNARIYDKNCRLLIIEW